MPLEMQTALSALSGVGPKRAAALADRGIATVTDLLYNLPLHYQDWRSRTPLAELKPATSAVVEGRLVGLKERPMRGMRWRRMATAYLEDAGGARIRAVWFNLPAYMKGRMPDGERVVMYGRVSETPDRGLEIIHPEVYPLDSGAPPAVRPVYGLPSEIGQRVYGGAGREALVAMDGRIEGAMPAALRARGWRDDGRRRAADAPSAARRRGPGEVRVRRQRGTFCARIRRDVCLPARDGNRSDTCGAARRRADGCQPLR